MWSLVFAFWPAHFAVVGWLAVLSLYYSATCWGYPQHTGERVMAPVYLQYLSTILYYSATCWGYSQHTGERVMAPRHGRVYRSTVGRVQAC